MAMRPVFYVDENNHTCIEKVNFTWFGGFAKSQVKKCIHSLHNASKFDSILEVSSYSDEQLGVDLSAFNLVDCNGISVECRYQASKVFENGGPYLDLLSATSMKAKKDERLKNSGKCIGFIDHGKMIESRNVDLFYNYIYLSTLHLYPEYEKQLLDYTAFSDIKYNPEKSIACQAKACSIYISLVRQGKLEEALQDLESFERIVYNK